MKESANFALCILRDSGDTLNGKGKHSSIEGIEIMIEGIWTHTF